MIDNKNIAKIPARFIIISYAVLQALFYIFYYIEILHFRLITSAALIILAIVLPNIKRLSGRHLSILLPLSIAAVELAAVTFLVDGNRLIYIFLIGASLVSLLYVNITGLYIMTSITSAAVIFLVFVCDVRLLGSQIELNYELFNFIGMFFVFVVVMMIGKYSVGMLIRFQRTGQTFDKVLEESSSLILIVNNQARVEYISKSFANILDIEKQEYAFDLPLTDLFPYVELKSFFGEMLEHEGTIETTFEIIKDGIRHNFMLHSIPIDIGDSIESKYKIARFFDCIEITPIIESQRAAEAATRSKSEFLAMMSHEIRTPLNAIIGITQIQLEDKSLTDQQAAAQEKILSSSDNLLRIINDILDMSKIETGKLDFNIMEYDMPSLINDTIQLNILRTGSKPIEFKLDINDTLPLRLVGDELRIKQVLNNLLSNAIKYTEKGYVKLTIKHSLSDENNDVMLTFVIEDTGQGMKPEDKERLFTEYLRFNTDVNRNTEGTGLGLHITQNLVEMMDGKISVESEYGKGSIFTVSVQQTIKEYIPIGVELAERLCNFTFSGERQAVKRQITREPMPYGNVLVVDDVVTNLFVAEGLLKPYKLNIETATSGFAAIEKIESGKNYNVIFMDHMMPLMDGIETTKKIREMGYTGLIVALTANALAGNDEMFAKNGFDGFIPKPIDIVLLNTVLNKFIRDRNPEEAKKYKPETTMENELPEVNPKLIKVFCRDAENAIIALRKTIVNNDIKLFTTTAHAMKSALGNIGESETSSLASTLEEAGLRGDKDFILINTENFILKLETLIKTLNPPINEESDSEIIDDNLYLAEQLKIIKNACEDYDDDTAYAAFNRLNERSWKVETSEFMEKIYDTLNLKSDFDEVVKMCEEFLKGIQ